MSNILFFSDIHIDCHKKSIDRLNHCLDALRWVFKTAKKYSIDDIVFAGDLFQNRQKIDTLIYHMTFKILREHCDGTVNLWLLLGNHDLWYRDKWDISSVHPFAPIPGVTVIDKPCTLNVGGTDIDFLPYTQTPIEHLAELRKSALRRAGQKTLVGHLAVHGAQLNTIHNTRADVVIEHDGEMVVVDPSVFNGWDQVFLGHYHGQQKVSQTVEYIGSPLQLTFGEAFQHKHCIIYDSDSGDKEYIRNKFSPQHFIIPEKDISKYDIENNFIRVEVEDLSALDMVDLKKEMQQLKPGTLEIQQSPTKVDSSHFIEDAKEILVNEEKMLEVYVDKVGHGDLDRELLISAGKLVICDMPKNTM